MEINFSMTPKVASFDKVLTTPQIDTLLVDQSLRATEPSKLVSRISEREDQDTPYSLVLEPRGSALYYKSKNSPRPILYTG